MGARITAISNMGTYNFKERLVEFWIPWSLCILITASIGEVRIRYFTSHPWIQDRISIINQIELNAKQLEQNMKQIRTNTERISAINTINILDMKNLLRSTESLVRTTEKYIQTKKGSIENGNGN